MAYRLELTWLELKLPAGAAQSGSRLISPATLAATRATVTSPGYLVEIDFSTPVYLSSRGLMVWSGQNWVPWGIGVALEFDGANSSLNGTLRLLNTDLAIGALVLGEGIAGKAIQIWSFYGDAALADDDPEPIFSGVGNGAEIDPDSGIVTISMQQVGGTTLYCPRTYINAASGHSFVPPTGTIINWNGETFVLRPED